LGDWQATGGYVGEATTNGGQWYQNAADVYPELSDIPLTDDTITAVAGGGIDADQLRNLTGGPLRAPWLVNQRAITRFMNDPTSTRVDLSPGNTARNPAGGNTLEAEIALVQQLASDNDWSPVSNIDREVIAWERSIAGTLDP